MNGRKLDAAAYAIGMAAIYAGSQLIAIVSVSRERRAWAVDRDRERRRASLLDRSAGVEHGYVGNAHVCGLCLTPRSHPLHAPDVERRCWTGDGLPECGAALADWRERHPGLGDPMPVTDTEIVEDDPGA